MTTILLPIFFNLLTILALWQTWRTRQNKTAKRIGSGLLLIASGVLWQQSYGAEFGLTFLAITSALMAMMLIGITSEKFKQNNRNKAESLQTEAEMKKTLKAKHSNQFKPRQVTFQAWPIYARRVGTFLVAGPVTFVFSTVICLLLVMALPGELANTLVIAAFMLPIMWSLGACWILSQPKRIRPSMIMAGVSMVGSMILIMIPTVP
ncbi:hypothetical protein [Pleionea mediterranea]|uniref:Uncharacterized protein n=1 Tax=Pleionea mediterranea TaxID=523701 RepID=A0A316FW74_9GAMM|nr:hypothetical protein [Pleionea mediterranea]PWK51850.1 hypothetical protein C8D97_105166 [Pleionea mediterranea]